MDETLILVLAAAAIIGLVAVSLISWRVRREEKPAAESPFGVSTEGMKTCARCFRQNLWTDARCLYCGAPMR